VCCTSKKSSMQSCLFCNVEGILIWGSKVWEWCCGIWLQDWGKEEHREMKGKCWGSDGKTGKLFWSSYLGPSLSQTHLESH
jgi:hypothetical protein